LHLFSIVQGQNSPTTVLPKFCDGYKNLNAQEVYDTLSTNMQAEPNSSEADIQKGFNQKKSSGSSITGCTVSDLQQNGSTAAGTITFIATSNGGSVSFAGIATLIQENGQWKINILADGKMRLLRVRYRRIRRKRERKTRVMKKRTRVGSTNNGADIFSSPLLRERLFLELFKKKEPLRFLGRVYPNAVLEWMGHMLHFHRSICRLLLGGNRGKHYLTGSLVLLC
jgi:hypothetical protein